MNTCKFIGLSILLVSFGVLAFAGIVKADDEAFSVTTLDATDISIDINGVTSGAFVGNVVTANESSVGVNFQWGLTQSYGNET